MFIIEILFIAFFGGSASYVLFFSAVAWFYKRSAAVSEGGPTTRFAILIPAYKEDGVIIPVSESMLALDYPQDLYDVYVIADQLQPETMDALGNLDVKVVEVKFEKSTKTKSLNYCLEQMDTAQYDMVLISDADNILAEDFLRKMDVEAQQGHKAIQGRRVAKNLNTDYAVLDGASEIINNHIFRKGPNAIGLSASLIGSGMAFDTKEVMDALNEINAVGGFDKVLQLKILEKGNVIRYVEDALVFDEKVESADNFKNQRRRWLSSQYKYLGKFFGKGVGQLFKGNFDYFNIAILHNLFLPRVISLGVLFVLAVLGVLLRDFLVVNFWVWPAFFAMYAFALAIALPRRFYGKKLLSSLVALPGAFLNMFLLLFRLKGADKTFIHTKHSQANVDNDMFTKK